MDVQELIERCPKVADPDPRAFVEPSLSAIGARLPAGAAPQIEASDERTFCFRFPSAEDEAARVGWLAVVTPRKTWLDAGSSDCRGEVPLWLSGALRELPRPLVCPTLAVGYESERDMLWRLMPDLRAHILPPKKPTEAHERALLGAVARLHARYWGRVEELDRLPIASAGAVLERFAIPILAVASGSVDRDETPPWARQMLAESSGLPAALTILLEVLGSRGADFYLDLVRDWPSLASHLDAYDPTLEHGDLRHGKIAFVGDQVHLLDWDQAASAPASCDLQRHWLLHFWTDAPTDGKRPAEREPLRQHYLTELESALGRGIDRGTFDAQWDLGWLAALIQLGHCIAAPLASPDHDRADIARVEHVAAHAIETAMRCRDRRVR